MAQDERPNILFLFTDDQRFDTIGALGYDEVSTPAMDALVERGTAFTNAYIMGGSCPAVCMPSRAMLMTGRTLYHLEAQGQRIPEAHVLLGEALQEAGYRTFGTGKWHNGPQAYARSFTDGAQIFFGGMDDHWNVPACDFDPTGQYDNAKPFIRTPFATNEVAYRHCDHIEPGKHSSELFSDAAIDFISSYEDEAPFFMYVSFMAPHDPRTMPRTFLEMYDPESVELPPNFMPQHPFDNGELEVRDELLAGFPRTPGEIRRHNAEYFAMISHLDAQIGRVLDALRQRGWLENTIIVLAGDNGLAIGRHGLMGKQNLYDHSLHVPLLMSGPGVPQGETRAAHAYLLDIYPTLCDLVGVSIPETVEGKSLVPALRSQEERIRDVMLFAYRGFQRAAQNDRYKLIEYVVDGKRTTQLFDLQEDPWELQDLAQRPAYAARRDELREQLKRWQDELGDDQEAQGAHFWAGFRD
ncbi:MAG: sulfatase-like hydrolase/transferase [Anaerolineae bacterium]